MVGHHPSCPSLQYYVELIITQAAATSATALSQPNGASTLSATTAPVPMPAELEQTLTLLSSHRSVLGYMLLSRGQPVSIIRHSGVIFEGEQGRKYASAIGRIIESVQVGLEEVYDSDSDGVSFFFKTGRDLSA
jgi:dynein light chain roadblock-type